MPTPDLEQRPPTPGAATPALVLSLAGLGYLLAGPGGPPPTGLLGLLGVGLLLEIGAARTGQFGFFSGATPWYLAALLAYPASGRLVGLALVIGLVLRTLVRGGVAWTQRGLELVSDLYPGALALAGTRFAQGFGTPVAALGMAPAPLFAAPVLFFFFWVTVAGIVSQGLPGPVASLWSRQRDHLFWMQAGLAVTPPLLAILAGKAAFLPLLALPLWAGLWPLARLSLVAETSLAQRAQQSEKDRELAQRQQSQARREVVQQRSARDLEIRLETYTLVEKLLGSLPNEPVVSKIASDILTQVRIRVPCQTVVLFLEVEGNLTPVSVVSPYADRLDGIALAGTHEAIVLRAFHTRRAALLEAGDRRGTRLFPEELKAVAVPMRDRGVIYVGDREEGDYSEDQIDFLGTMANHLLLAVEAARFQEAQQLALIREAQAHAGLESLVQRLAVVLDGLAELVAITDADQLLARCGELLGRVLPHDFRALQAANRRTFWPPNAPLHPPALAEILDAVRQNARPLLLEAGSSSRLVPPTPELTSYLAVPIVTERGCLGTLLVGHRQPTRYTRQDLDILSVLAYQLGGAFVSAELYSELQETHQALKESQAQLIQSSKMAAIGQLAGGVAHELNTPLGAISLAVDGALANVHSKPERAEARLTKAVRSVAQMKEIVSKLLFYSRDAASKRRETDLNKVIDDTLQMIGNQFRLDNVEVETRLQPLPSLIANQNELQQVVTNLLINARDAVLMKADRPGRIQVRTQALPGLVRLQVQDWGVGMDEATRARIFEPFFTTKDVGQGTGLGLSVTLQLIEQHKGRVQVATALGQGTVFTVDLPLDAEDPEAQ